MNSGTERCGLATEHPALNLSRYITSRRLHLFPLPLHHRREQRLGMSFY